MDVAKHLAQWQEQPREQWFRAANRYLPPGVTTVLVIAIAYQLAALTWALAPGGVPIAELSAGRATSTRPVTAPPASYEALVTTPLFGEALNASVQPALPLVDAPDTTLSLALTGTLWEDPDGQAIISTNRGEQKTYRVGQAIDNANGATLYAVYADRVLLNRGDRLETLRQELIAGTAVPRSSTQVAPSAAAPGSDDSLRTAIAQKAPQLIGAVQFVPHIQGGKVVGFQVNPGRDRESFVALGFMPGDIVTEVNGIVLDGARSGSQVFEALAEATTANVTVLREGAATVLVIDTSQLQNLRPGNDGGN